MESVTVRSSCALVMPTAVHEALFAAVPAGLHFDDPPGGVMPRR
jgi:hypothetical protein